MAQLPGGSVQPLVRARARRTAMRWCASLALALCSGPAAAAPADVPPAPPVVTVEPGRVTVDVRDAELADVLSALATRADFELETTGSLGRVTAGFTAASVEQALRRLVQDHEMMLVYGPPRDGGEAQLLHVEVFAGAPPSRVAGGSVSNVASAERSALLAEIRRLARASGDPQAVTRLTELSGAEDATVRARAVSTLARIGGASAAPVLAQALRDPSPQVRVQAIYSLRPQGASAIPAVSGLLLGDPDVTVRRAAARMLRGLPDAEAISALGAAVHDQDPVVRREATRALQPRD